jgi:hypothetical protein
VTGPRRVAGRAEAAGVVVPAHNEEEFLPACLAALREAAGSARIPVHLLVVADACTDETAAVAADHGAQVIRIRARNVGAARAAGMTALLRRTAGTDPAAVWLATTDADTIVPPGWLRRQLGHAGQGWDVVLGTVTVTDWAGYPPHVAAAFAAMYGFGEGPHPHVHGANLGIRASAYLAAGGFRPLRTAEDHALLTAATEAGGRVLRAGDITVQTSARRRARAPRGFSHVLRALSREPASGGSAPSAPAAIGPASGAAACSDRPPLPPPQLRAIAGSGAGYPRSGPPNMMRHHGRMAAGCHPESGPAARPVSTRSVRVRAGECVPWGW